MKIRRQLPLGLALGSSLLLSGTLPAGAQTGNQSDVTGAIITTGDIAGGAFAPQVGNQSDVTGAITTTGDIAGDAFAPRFGGGGGAVARFTNPDIARAVNQAAVSLNAQVAQGTLTVAATSAPTTSISAAVQQILQSLLTGTDDDDASSSQIERALANAPGAPDRTLVRNLVSSLQGLTAGGTVSPTGLAAAIEAYNALIDASGGEFLANPQPELLAIQSALSTLVNAALAAR